MAGLYRTMVTLLLEPQRLLKVDPGMDCLGSQTHTDASNDMANRNLDQWWLMEWKVALLADNFPPQDAGRR